MSQRLIDYRMYELVMNICLACRNEGLNQYVDLESLQSLYEGALKCFKELASKYTCFEEPFQRLAATWHQDTAGLNSKL